jgi:peptidyl-prolyl cis-trans isomerase SurA
MKKLTYSAASPMLSILVLAILMISPGPARSQNLDLSDTGVLVDGIAAIVNDGVVLLSELDEQTRMIVARMREENTELPPQDVLIPQILERLIVNELQMQRAAMAGINVPDGMLNRALADVARRNGTTLPQLPELLAQYGIDYASYRKEMRQQLILEQLRQREVISRIGVTPREVEEYLNREQGSAYRDNSYQVSHILISIPAASTPDEIAEAGDKAADLYARIQQGEDFAKLAIANSDAQNALEGGNMGWRDGDSLPTLFADIVPGLEPGQTAEPLRSASGFHLIKLDEVKGNERVMENQVRARHILLVPNEIMDDAVTEQRLQEIRADIVNGDDFAAIAKAVSEDPGSAIEGGDLGWAGPGTFVPEFEATIDSLAIDEMSEPFRSPFGWHVVQLLERRVHDATDDVRQQRAIMAIRESKLAEETELWLRQMRDEAFIEYRI